MSGYVSTHRVSLLVTVVALCFGATGCATAVKGTTQMIPVSTFPADATVTVNGVSHSTPCVLKLQRSKTHSLHISKEGYHPQVVPLGRVANGETRGNLWAGGLIGYAVDAASGANYDLVPSQVNVVLEAVDGSQQTQSRQAIVASQ